MKKQPNRKIIVVVGLEGEKIAVPFSQNEYTRVEGVANALRCSVADFARDTAIQIVDNAKARRNIIQFPGTNAAKT